MKVLHVITTMDLGGAEKHVATLAAAQADLGHEVRILYLRGRGPALPPGIPSQQVGLLDFREVGSFRRWLRDGGLVHAHLPRAEIAGACIASRSIPLIISRHNTEPFFGETPSLASRRGSQLIATQADTVIAISQAVRDYHLSTGHLRETTRIEVVPYGYLPPSNSAREPYSWGGTREGTLRIACVARLTPQKDLQTLLLGVSRLRSMGYPADLRIAGEGPERSALISLRESLGLTNSVTFLGKISNPETFIAGADVFALTSKYEGLGLVLLEAMSAGTPVVAARNTAINEVVVDGETGLLFETGNADDLAVNLIRISEDEQLASRLVADGRRRLMTHFGVDRMVNQTNEIYWSALERAH